MPDDPAFQRAGDAAFQAFRHHIATCQPGPARTKGAGKLPIIPAPTGTRFQPIDATEVAERMAELALGEPSGLAPDLAGPKIYTVAELVNSYLRAAGKRRPLIPVHIPGQAAKAIRAGANLPPDRAIGKRTWEQYLADQL